MGKKNRKKESDEDYFATLAASTQAVEEDEAEEEARLAREEAAARRAAERKAKDEADKLERAESAARARLAMEKRLKKAKEEDDEEDEVVEEDEEEEEEVEEERDEEQVVDGSAEEEEEVDDDKKEPPSEPSLTGRVLLFARSQMASGGLLALLFGFLFALLRKLASAETLRRLEATTGDSFKLRCPVTCRRLEKVTPATVREEGQKFERFVKNLKTKSKQQTWTKLKPGDGFASAPDCMETDAPEGKIRFFALLEDDDEYAVYDVTTWISAHVINAAATKDLDLVDSLKPPFSVVNEGSLVATLNPKLHAEILAKSQQSNDGGSQQKPASSATKKDKMSRADKKARKLGQRR
mmetsp:Transcript_9030/g.29285  ORF Transcript_9030/g.29285 Transcript_9030/m.29285 type:complete len:353 (-) Transcript_9030:410-1468(-)